MKILYFGGQKSGKSTLAEQKALELATQKPYYIATYDNSFGDASMQSRVQKHQKQREDNFITLEETKNLSAIIKENETYLIDCVSMWIFNHLDSNEDEILTELEKIAQKDATIIFVLNEVTSGVIPLDKQSRKFVDLTGIVGQKLVSFCNEVYEVKFGLTHRLK